MTGLRYDQLPAKARAQVDAKLGRKPRQRLDRGEHGGPCPYRCRACGEVSPTWTAAERHARDLGHVRQEMVLPD